MNFRNTKIDPMLFFVQISIPTYLLCLGIVHFPFLAKLIK